MNAFSISALMSLLGTDAAVDEPAAPRVLVFSKTAGYRHDSIAAGLAAVRELATDGGFAVDATEDAAAFSPENLAAIPRRRVPQQLGRSVRRKTEGGVPGLHPRRRRACGRASRSHDSRQVAVVRRFGRRREVRGAPQAAAGDCATARSATIPPPKSCPSLAAGSTNGTTSSPIPARGPTS